MMRWCSGVSAVGSGAADGDVMRWDGWTFSSSSSFLLHIYSHPFYSRVYPFVPSLDLKYNTELWVISRIHLHNLRRIKWSFYEQPNTNTRHKKAVVSFIYSFHPMACTISVSQSAQSNQTNAIQYTYPSDNELNHFSTTCLLVVEGVFGCRCSHPCAFAGRWWCWLNRVKVSECWLGFGFHLVFRISFEFEEEILQFSVSWYR